MLREAQETGRRATITTVERRLDVKHATFYRNFPHLIAWFQEQVDAQRNLSKPEQNDKVALFTSRDGGCTRVWEAPRSTVG
ncbi:hypothetical protein [Streptomyces broussonetiae]|uniref:TetR family transcriptional regulator n=1 Tax=Streptomyces broussonetiae TaxID=2686304 RepID=A0ABV5EI00_9ACTN